MLMTKKQGDNLEGRMIRIDMGKIKRKPEPDFGPTYLPNPAVCHTGCHRPCPMTPRCTAYRREYKGYMIRK